jgi:hypothetical protein
MVLVMESDGSLTPSRSQDSFARHYQDGIAVGPGTRGLTILGSADPVGEPDTDPFAGAERAPVRPSPEVLAAIEATGLRYASHPGLRRATLSVTDWLLLYRANIEVESAYRQEAVSTAGAIGLGQLMPETGRRARRRPDRPLREP